MFVYACVIFYPHNVLSVSVTSPAKFEQKTPPCYQQKHIQVNLKTLHVLRAPLKNTLNNIFLAIRIKNRGAD